MKKDIFLGFTFLFVCANVVLAQHKYIDQSAIDKTVRAADNFYEYANGNWLKTNDSTGPKRLGQFYHT